MRVAIVWVTLTTIKQAPKRWKLNRRTPAIGARGAALAMIGLMPSDRLKVATYNAHGVRGKEYEVSQISTRIKILSVCKTWLRPQDILQTSLFDELVSVTQSHRG